MFALVVVSLNLLSQHNLAYGSRLEIDLLNYKSMPVKQIVAIVSEKWAKAKERGRPLEDQILAIGVGACASGFFHAVPYPGTNRRDLFDWISKNLHGLSDGAEKEALKSLTDYDPTTSPTEFSPKSIQGSSLVAWAVALHWDMKCHSEQDLKAYQTAIARLKKASIHQSNQLNYEAGYQFAVFSVNKDMKALRKCVDLKYAAAAVDPNPKAKENTKRWCRIYEQYLRKNGS